MTRRRGRGEGSVTQRSDGRWQGFVSLPGGKRKYVYGKTRQETARMVSAITRQASAGVALPDERLTVGAFLTTWLAGVRSTLRPQSMRRYEQLTVDHVIPFLGSRRLARLAPDDLQRLYSAKLAAGLAPATVRLMHCIMHRALRDAERWGKCIRNVADLVDPPRVPRKEAAVLSLPQVHALLAAARGERLEALFVLAVKTGLRRGELLGLRWSDVDLEAGVIRVTRTLQPSMYGSGHTLAELKSSSSRRSLVLGTQLTEVVRGHRATQLAERLLVGAEWAAGDFVFTTELGRTIAPGTLIRAWNRVLLHAGIDHVPFHTTRHTAATLMLAAGVSPRVAQDRLGHSTVSMTLDRYSHLTEAMRDGVALAVDSILDASAPSGERVSERVSNPHPEPRQTPI